MYEPKTKFKRENVVIVPEVGKCLVLDVLPGTGIRDGYFDETMYELISVADAESLNLDRMENLIHKRESDVFPCTLVYEALYE